MKTNRKNVYETLDIFDITEMMVEEYVRGKYAVAILFFDEAAALIKELLNDDFFKISTLGINIAPPEFDGYEKEFIVTLTPDGEIGCEKAYREKNEYHDAGYITGCDEFVLIDCRSEYPEELYKEYETVVIVDLEHDECKSDEAIELIKNENNEFVGLETEIECDGGKLLFSVKATDAETFEKYLKMLETR